MVAKKKKMIQKNRESYRYELPIKKLIYWISSRLAKFLQFQKCTFSEKVSKSKNNITFLNFMTTFHNFALKIETVEIQGWLSPY